jgi:hypothetical protein
MREIKLEKKNSEEKGKDFEWMTNFYMFKLFRSQDLN